MVQYIPVITRHGRQGPTGDSFQMDVQSLPQLLESQDLWKDIEKQEAQQRSKKAVRASDAGVWGVGRGEWERGWAIELDMIPLL